MVGFQEFGVSFVLGAHVIMNMVYGLYIGPQFMQTPTRNLKGPRSIYRTFRLLRL